MISMAPDVQYSVEYLYSEWHLGRFGPEKKYKKEKNKITVPHGFCPYLFIYLYIREKCKLLGRPEFFIDYDSISAMRTITL